MVLESRMIGLEEVIHSEFQEEWIDCLAGKEEALVRNYMK